MGRRLRFILFPIALFAIYGWLTFRAAGWYAFVFMAQLAGPLIAVLLGFDLLTRLIYLIISWCVRFRFLTCAVGPFAIIREWNGIRIRRNYGPRVGVDSYTRDPKNLPQRLKIPFLTTPVASLLVGLMTFLIGFSRYRSHGYDPLVFPLAMPLFAAIGILRASFGASDESGELNIRARLAMLRTGGAAAERFYALILLSGARYEGLRPRDWPADFIQRISIPTDGSPDEIGALVAVYYHALDRGDTTWAGHVLARLIELSSIHATRYRDIVYAEAAFYQAFVHRDAAGACAYIEQFQWQRGSERRQCRVEAALLLAEGKREEAWERARQGTALPDHVSQYGVYCAERDWFSAIMGQAVGSEGPTANRQHALA
jgi:hypothetical protein